MDDATLAALLAITQAAADEDGVQPLDEGAWRRLRHHGDELDVRVVPGEGFTVADGADLHLVVAPDARRHGVGAGLLSAVVADADHGWRSWSHGDHPGAARLADRFGFERVRELWVMRRDLAGPTGAETEGGEVEVRAFRRGEEPELLRVNAAAFAHHPEQGAMDAEELAERMAEPWFDPADLLVGTADGQMLGFHWTKRHSAEVGEVYVMAVDPSAQGRGLGRTLLTAGLDHLHGRGVSQVLLYVESDNTQAVGLYAGRGFTHTGVDTHVMYARPAAG